MPDPKGNVLVYALEPESATPAVKPGKADFVLDISLTKHLSNQVNIFSAFYCGFLFLEKLDTYSINRCYTNGEFYS